MNKGILSFFLPALVFATGIWGGYAVTQNIRSAPTDETPPNSVNSRTEKASSFIKHPVKRDIQEPPTFSNKNLKAFIQRIDSGVKPSDFQKEFQKLLQAANNEEQYYRYLAIMHLLSQWGSHDTLAALDAVMSLSGEMGEMKKFFIPFALNSLIEKDPAKAAEMFTQTGNGLYAYPSILPDICQSLTKKSPDEAWQWLSSLKVQEQNHAMAAFFNQLSHTVPERITEFIEQLQPSEQWGTGTYQDKVRMESIIGDWSKTNYSEAEKWVTSLTEKWKNNLMPVLLGIKAKNDTEGALSMMMELPDAARSKAFNEIGDSVFLSGDERAISAWLDSVQKIEPDVDSDYYSFMDGISPINRLSIIEKLPQGKVKDSMIAYSLRYDLLSDEDTKLRLVKQIKDSVLQQKSLDNLKKEVQD